jgi:CDP-diacylglycerol--glycerol-3-phosphate 3-phosphatidyltransferase
MSFDIIAGGRRGARTKSLRPRDADDAKTPIPLDLVVRSIVADFGYLPVVNALIGSLAGTTISAWLGYFIIAHIPYGVAIDAAGACPSAQSSDIHPVMNLPNLITLSRIPLMFVVVWLMYQTWTGAATLAFWLFIAAAIGDWLDGYLARKMGLISLFGKFMDALTDKIFVVGIMIAFVEQDVVPIYFVLIVLCREFLISGMRMMAAAKGVVVAAERGGKTKTLTQLIAVGFLLFVPMLSGDVAGWLNFDFSAYSEVIHHIGLWLFILSVFFTVQSGWVYLAKYRGVLFDEEKK